MKTVVNQKELAELAREVRYAEQFTLPDLSKTLRWLEIYRAKLSIHGIETDFQEFLGVTPETFYRKEEARVARCRETLKKLQRGEIKDRAAWHLTNTRQVLHAQQESITGECMRWEDVRYLVEEKFPGPEAVHAADEAVEEYGSSNEGADSDEAEYQRVLKAEAEEGGNPYEESHSGYHNPLVPLWAYANEDEPVESDELSDEPLLPPYAVN